MFLLSDLKVDKTEIFDGVKECSVKRALARQKCETDKCAVKHTRYQSEIFLSRRKVY